MADAEVRVRWQVDGHSFEATVTIERGLMTLRMELPTAFLESASDATRKAYGASRDQALETLSAIVSEQLDGPAAEPNHVTH